MAEVSRFLLDLYRLTGSAPSAEFAANSMALFKAAVHIDAGVWGTFTATPSGPLPHWHCLYELPDQMMQEYERVKQHDILNNLAVANCGSTVNVSLTQAEKDAHPDMVAHARRWGMEHTLATMWLESPLNLYTAICVYRSDPGRPFSEDERRFMEALVPHLVQAWHLNAIHFLDAAAGRAHGSRRARGLIDRFGVVHNAEPALPSLLRQEVPDWEGPNIRRPLLAALDQGAPAYKGRTLVVSRLRQLPDSMFIISVRLRTRVDSLTPRELIVARQFASGKTHKDIAGLLGTSPATVRSQLQAVYQKLRVRTKVGLLKHVEDAD